MKNIALILASGTGSRCKLGFPKQFAKINNKTILEYTINAFENHNLIDEIYIVTSKEFINTVKNIINTSNYKKIKNVITGGETRKDSSYNGISAIPYTDANVLIHDGVRPLIDNNTITNCIDTLKDKNAVCVTIESSDTIFVTNEDGVITNIPKRQTLKRAQTPQCFKLNIIKKAHELAKKDKNCQVTDDCGLIINYNLADIYTINGSTNNIKVTYPEDIDFVKKFLDNTIYE